MVVAVRWLCVVLLATLAWNRDVGAQGTTGTINGRVVDSASATGLANVTVAVDGTQLGTLTRADGSFTLAGVPAGSRSVVARRIGYGSTTRTVNVEAGQIVTVQMALTAVAASLS